VPGYLSEWVPATLITGLGIGLTFPVLSAAAVSSLHAERFAVGSAVNQTARQIGGAFGVAILVVILGTPSTRAAALTGFQHLWMYAALMALASGGLCALLKGRSASTTATVAEAVVAEAVVAGAAPLH
jgi:hypothetical protein